MNCSICIGLQSALWRPGRPKLSSVFTARRRPNRSVPPTTPEKPDGNIQGVLRAAGAKIGGATTSAAGRGDACRVCIALHTAIMNTAALLHSGIAECRGSSRGDPMTRIRFLDTHPRRAPALPMTRVQQVAAFCPSKTTSPQVASNQKDDPGYINISLTTFSARTPCSRSRRNPPTRNL